ncbi:MAG: 2-phospho-L-lactate transferase [Nitrospiraceae bacterium]|nr:2-phospho-L-lactate transferase [Nitrospiraceae bacterium]MDA8262054.1 2-phospho-L-lactate transferase [Actinomycetota bacterium]
MIAVLCGGVGAAKFLDGALRAFDGEEVVAIANVADDEVMHGLHISPDIDTILYTLSGQVNPETGWGLAGESWRVMERLEKLGGQTWFHLGDLDLATHLYRSARLGEGATLTEVTAELAERYGLGVRLLPATDGDLRTIVSIRDNDGSVRDVTFQEYFVKLRHEPHVKAVSYRSAGVVTPAPEVMDALATARAIVFAPSNPVLSIAPILAIGEIAETVAKRRNDVVAVTPIVEGRAIKGPADRVLDSLGFESSALGVARFYADYSGTFVLDTRDSELAGKISSLDIRVRHTDTIMHDTATRTALAEFVRGVIEGV